MFLDDDYNRHIAFDNMIGRSVDIVHVWSCDEAVATLSSRQFDMVFLDHDLSEEDVMSVPGQKTKCKTGMDVVEYIESMERQTRPTRAVVHSMNPVASRLMVNRLCDIGIDGVRIPFHMLKSVIDLEVSR